MATLLDEPFSVDDVDDWPNWTPETITLDSVSGGIGFATIGNGNSYLRLFTQSNAAELLALWRNPGDGECGIGLGNESTGYGVRYYTSSDLIRLESYNATFFSANEATSQQAHVIAPTTWYWTRLRVAALDVKVRIWADGGGEPGTWTMEWVPSNSYAAFDEVGVFGNGTAHAVEYNSIVITDGAAGGISIPVVYHHRQRNFHHTEFKRRRSGLYAPEIPAFRRAA